MTATVDFGSWHDRHTAACKQWHSYRCGMQKLTQVQEPHHKDGVPTPDPLGWGSQRLCIHMCGGRLAPLALVLQVGSCSDINDRLALQCRLQLQQGVLPLILAALWIAAQKGSQPALDDRLSRYALHSIVLHGLVAWVCGSLLLRTQCM